MSDNAAKFLRLSVLVSRVLPLVQNHCVGLGTPWPRYTLFLSLCNTHERARVIHQTGDDFSSTWDMLVEQAHLLVQRENFDVQWLRVDWVTSIREITWKGLRASLKAVKRNYFRYGLALDPTFSTAFLEGELNANAMLYGGSHIEHAVVNEKNFRIYSGQRFKNREINFGDDEKLWVLLTQGVFCAADEKPQLLYRSGLDAGRRIVGLDAELATRLIDDGSRYLSTQLKDNGRFRYGWHPCFDRAINAYNTLRHASTTYSMLESWEVTNDPGLKQAIDRSIGYLVSELIKTATLPDGQTAAFLLDVDNEIKLGGNAVCILALVKYVELFQADQHRELLEQLALGIAHMQNVETGAFVHVLQYPELEVKDAFRVIYYDGEAAFALMRLYGLTRDERWLAVVENAFRYFIAKEHWRNHDHWLSYCVNELTMYRPTAEYYEFGIRNVADYLDFVRTRITTFPTLLELMMATELMISRLVRDPKMRHLLDGLDMRKVQRAIDFRANHLMNGHFWPELAMYYRNPRRIVGSFFIRHHAFRVRIDDVEHYLSGFVAYRRFLLKNGGSNTLSYLHG